MDAEDDWESYHTVPWGGYANYHLWVYARYLANFGAGATIKVGLNVSGQGSKTYEVYKPKALFSTTTALSPTKNPTKSKGDTPSRTPSPSTLVPDKSITLDETGQKLSDAMNSAKSSFEKAKAALALAQKYKALFSSFKQPPPQKSKVRREARVPCHTA